MGAALSYDYGSQAGYGGWLTERPAATGDVSSITRLVGWAAAVGAMTYIGTGGELSLDRLQRNHQHAMQWASGTEVAEVTPVRTPAEDLARIRDVLKPAISDLASTFGVSRQSVYNWINGEQVSEENSIKLHDLAQAADVLAHEGIIVNAALLKRKFANGRTLMQVVQAGDSARNAVLLLVQIHKREAAQRQRMQARFEGRAKTSATADFDLPSSNYDA